MPRAHLHKGVTDSSGNLIQNVSVSLYEPGTTTPIADPIFLDDTTLVSTAQPLTFASGEIDLYLERARRVRLSVTAPNAAPNYYEDVDISGPADPPSYVRLRSPNGTIFDLAVADDGTVSATAEATP